MRAIKFRAKSIDDDSLDKLIEFELFDITNTFPEDDVLIIKGVAVDATTIQQFTGILDSDGEEIYEGDILQQQTVVNGKHYGQGKPLIVEWLQSEHQTGWNIFRSMKHMKKTGNIYQNPKSKR